MNTVSSKKSGASTSPSCRYEDDDEHFGMPDGPPPKWAHLPMAEQIAEAIVECMNKNGQCWIIDIRAMGFSLNDIARHWPDACTMAARKRPKPSEQNVSITTF